MNSSKLKQQRRGRLAIKPLRDWLTIVVVSLVVILSITIIYGRQLFRVGDIENELNIEEIGTLSDVDVALIEKVGKVVNQKEGEIDGINQGLVPIVDPSL